MAGYYEELRISPKYQMELVTKVIESIESVYKGEEVLHYIKKWHIEADPHNYGDRDNFNIYKHDDSIALKETIHGLPGAILLKMAIDLEIETPDFIPSVPNFKDAISSKYPTTYQNFVKALNNVEEEPDIAVGLANSALESIIKEIMKDTRLSTINHNNTTKKLLDAIIKEFFKNEMPPEIKNICTHLNAIGILIEKLRSDKTFFHGKTNADYVINESILAYLAVNSVTTLGLFLLKLYDEKCPPEISFDDVPF